MKAIVSTISPRTSEHTLSDPQRAAVARLLYAVREQQGDAVLCGPGGTGVSTVVACVANELQSAGQNVVCVNGHDLVHDSQRFVAGQAVDHQFFAGLERSGEKAAQSALIIDDGHVGDAARLAHFVVLVRVSLPAVAVLLAGRGRLLSLVAREQALQERVLLRAVLPSWSLRETSAFVKGQFKAAGVSVSDDTVVVTIHEIAAGIPQVVVRLVETALLVAAMHPAHSLGRDDVEQMHDRLSLAAA